MDGENKKVIVDAGDLAKLLEAFQITYDKLLANAGRMLDSKPDALEIFTREESAEVLAGLVSATGLHDAIYSQTQPAVVGYPRGVAYQSRPSGKTPLFAVPFSGTAWLDERWNVVDRLSSAFVTESDAPDFEEFARLAFDGDSRGFWHQVGLRCNEYGYSTYTTENGFAVFPRETVPVAPKPEPSMPSARAAASKPFSPRP